MTHGRILTPTSGPGSALSYALTMHQMALGLNRAHPSPEMADFVIEFELKRDALWKKHDKARKMRL